MRQALVLVLLWSGDLAGASDFTAEDLAFISAMGPWPPALSADPSNAWSGDQKAIEYGRALFFDQNLSGDRNINCATCHKPDRAFSEDRPRSRGNDLADRNAPALVNLGAWRWFGWDGRSDTLWEQSIHPIISDAEMGLAPDALPARLDPDAYEELFGAAPSETDTDRVLTDVGKALAAFQETLTTNRTPFDDYRDALIAGRATPPFPAEAIQGLKLFVGKGNCVLCHFGPTFSNGEFHDIGLPFFVDGSRVDKGRFGGIQSYFASQYTFGGPYSDASEEEKAVAPGAFVDLRQRNWGEFRVPSLREVARTAPYMHNGSLDTLEEVVRHYSDLDLERLHVDGESLLRPLALTDAEVQALVAFLETLSEPPSP